MSKLKVTIVSLATVSASVFGVWTLGSCLLREHDSASAEHLANQVWLERLPTDDRDMITHFLALDTRDGRFGLVGRSSTWRHVLEVFKWDRKGDRLMLFFPQERSRAAFKVRTWECKGEAPAPFELCLEFARGERSLTFYSRHEWVVEPQEFIEDRDQVLRELAAENSELRPLVRSLAAIESEAGEAVENDATTADDSVAWALLGGR